jgi:hypothetical protein
MKVVCCDVLSDLEEFRNLVSFTNRKATGPDGINMELIKYTDPLFHWRLLHIINQCWLTYKVPESWKIAEVIYLFKIYNRRKCKNYRRISLLNTIYKIYARIGNKRLRTISEALLEEQQNGFRIR